VVSQSSKGIEWLRCEVRCGEMQREKKNRRRHDCDQRYIYRYDGLLVQHHGLNIYMLYSLCVNTEVWAWCAKDR